MTKPRGSLYVAEIKRHYKDRVYTTFLLRCSFREDGKVKQQTLANLTHLPPDAIEAVRHSLKGTPVVPFDEAFEVVRSRAYGHVAAVRAMLRQLGLHEIIAARPSRPCDLVEAMIVARVVDSQTKLATSRWWHSTTLPEDLGIEGAGEDDLYDAMDWLLDRKPAIEKRLAARHLEAGSLVLYDVSSTYYEGSHCPLCAFGHNRDRKKGKRQIVFGLLTTAQGCPVSVEVFPGNTGDPSTVESRVQQINERFGLSRVILAGDRGMLTSARIDQLKELGGIDWVSALRAPAIKRLAEAGLIQLSLFDTRDLAEIVSPDFPGERLVVCRNPYLAEDRTRTRNELLEETEKLLKQVQRRVTSGRLKARAKIGLAVGRVIDRYKMAKHFTLDIEDGHFTFTRNQATIRLEEQLDGIYVLRTSVSEEKWSAAEVVSSYKSLKHAERAFRTLKSVDLKVRPIHHRLPDRVKSHIFLCTLAYYVEWHLRQAWRPLLFDDEDPGHHLGGSPVTPAVRSEGARRKASRKEREDRTPVHSFQTLLAELSTLVRNDVRIPAQPELDAFAVVTTPTPLQREACERVGLKLQSGTKGRQKHSA